ncbi:MAG: histidine ammonia-lyase [Bacteriovoracaceae bacterium]
MNTIILDGQSLTLEQIYDMAHDLKGNYRVTIDPKAMAKMIASREFVFDVVKKGEPVYGINTGFGALASKHIEEKDLAQLQINLIRSHCTGVGKPFPRATSRAIMILRANCLISGYSGVNPEIVELLLDFLNNGITPVVPEKGSVGASGDLAPLSHIALALIGEGEVEYHGKVIRSEFAINEIKKNPVVLGPKDGLALINGTAVMAALGSLALYEAKILARTADIISAMTLEAVRGTASAFHPGISKLKPHKGQIAVAKNMVNLLANSEILNSHHDCGKVQDPYSLRCIPQVHGSCRQTIQHAEEVIVTELNSVTDNPLIFVDTGEVVSGGNFHGEALALAMDYLAMGLSEFANISERRVEKMMNPTFSDLPAFLTKNSGLNSGLMIAHVTAAALASENKYLCHPASVDSIPTSTDKEDHVSMGVTSGRKLHQVLENLKYCLSVELLCNTQAMEFLKPLKSSKPLNAVYNLVRKHVKPIEEDRILYKDIENLNKLIHLHEIVDCVEKEIGQIY